MPFQSFRKLEKPKIYMPLGFLSGKRKKKRERENWYLLLMCATIEKKMDNLILYWLNNV